MRIERHNLDGTGIRRYRVYDMPPSTDRLDYWRVVTNVPCPAAGCAGLIRWAEANHVPGWRICDGCGRHYLAQGTGDAPSLIYMRRR